MRDQTIKSAIQSSQLPIREYVRNLESENAKLQRKIAKFQCNDLSQKNEISALKKKLNAYLKKGHLTVVVRGHDENS